MNAWLRCAALGVVMCVGACGSSVGDDNAADASTPGDSPDASIPSGPFTDELSTGTGCVGVYNPDQILDYHITMAPGDFSSLQNDMTNSVYFPAEMSCGTDPAITVAVRRKRSGGTVKSGMKVDINRIVPGQTHFGLKKFSWENGSSDGEPDGSPGDLLVEYLSWRMMVLSGVVTGRASFVQVFVNGDLLGVYVSVEAVDKHFLETRLGDKSGWLFKKSGVRDEYKTNETLPNPFEAYFCFFDNNGCPIPSDAELAATLPGKLDIGQMLSMGAVNALIANHDGPIFKDNNYYFYDYASGPRKYIPWDLDSVMDKDFDVFAGPTGPSTAVYVDVLFSNWESDYDDILTELVSGPLALDVVTGEIDRAAAVAGAAMAQDPHMAAGTLEAAAADSTAWWAVRHPSVVDQVAAH